MQALPTWEMSVFFVTKNMPAGRPFIYDKEKTVESANAYIDSCKDEQYTLIKTEGESTTSWENKIRVKLPTIEGLAVYLKVSRWTVYDWKEKYPEFAEVIDRLQAEQADRLLNNGLSNDYNSTITKVLLTKHGYREGTELTGADGKDLIPSEVQRKTIGERLKDIL